MVQTAIPALSNGQTNFHTPIWGGSHQLDDHKRNPYDKVSDQGPVWVRKDVIFQVQEQNIFIL